MAEPYPSSWLTQIRLAGPIWQRCFTFIGMAHSNFYFSSDSGQLVGSQGCIYQNGWICRKAILAEAGQFPCSRSVDVLMTSFIRIASYSYLSIFEIYTLLTHKTDQYISLMKQKWHDNMLAFVAKCMIADFVLCTFLVYSVTPCS